MVFGYLNVVQDITVQVRTKTKNGDLEKKEKVKSS